MLGDGKEDINQVPWFNVTASQIAVLANVEEEKNHWLHYFETLLQDSVLKLNSAVEETAQTSISIHICRLIRCFLVNDLLSPEQIFFIFNKACASNCCVVLKCLSLTKHKHIKSLFFIEKNANDSFFYALLSKLAKFLLDDQSLATLTLSWLDIYRKSLQSQLQEDRVVVSYNSDIEMEIEEQNHQPIIQHTTMVTMLFAVSHLPQTVQACTSKLMMSLTSMTRPWSLMLLFDQMFKEDNSVIWHRIILKALSMSLAHVENMNRTCIIAVCRVWLKMIFICKGNNHIMTDLITCIQAVHSNSFFFSTMIRCLIDTPDDDKTEWWLGMKNWFLPLLSLLSQSKHLYKVLCSLFKHRSVSIEHLFFAVTEDLDDNLLELSMRYDQKQLMENDFILAQYCLETLLKPLYTQFLETLHDKDEQSYIIRQSLAGCLCCIIEHGFSTWPPFRLSVDLVLLNAHGISGLQGYLDLWSMMAPNLVCIKKFPELSFALACFQVACQCFDFKFELSLNDDFLTRAAWQSIGEPLLDKLPSLNPELFTKIPWFSPSKVIHFCNRLIMQHGLTESDGTTSPLDILVQQFCINMVEPESSQLLDHLFMLLNQGCSYQIYKRVIDKLLNGIDNKISKNAFIKHHIIDQSQSKLLWTVAHAVNLVTLVNCLDRIIDAEPNGCSTNLIGALLLVLMIPLSITNGNVLPQSLFEPLLTRTIERIISIFNLHSIFALYKFQWRQELWAFKAVENEASINESPFFIGKLPYAAILNPEAPVDVLFFVMLRVLWQYADNENEMISTIIIEAMVKVGGAVSSANNRRFLMQLDLLTILIHIEPEFLSTSRFS